MKLKYHSVLTRGLDLSPNISQTINSEISRETNIPDDTCLNEEEIESQTEEKSDDDVSNTQSDDDSDYESSILLECRAAIENVLEGFHSFMIGPHKGRKLRSNEEVVGDVRRIFKLLALDDIREFFVNDTDLLRMKYLMEYCAEKKNEPRSIKKYLASNVDFINFIIIMKIDVGVDKEEVARCKLLLQTWRKVYKQKEIKLKPLKREVDLKMMVTEDQIKFMRKVKTAGMQCISLMNLKKTRKCP